MIALPSATASLTCAVAELNCTVGADYVGVDDSLIIPAGAISATFDVLMVNDNIAEPVETANLALDTPVNATLGTPANATLTILDDDTAPKVQFSSTTYSVNEAASTAVITVSLTAAAAAPVTVNFATSNGTATAGQDYIAITNGTLKFAVG